MQKIIKTGVSKWNKIFPIIFCCIISVQTTCAQWMQVSNGIGNISVMSFVNSGNIIFAGTAGYVYLSTNEGLSWSQSGLVIPNNYVVYGLAVNGNNIFAGTGPGNGVYKSTDNGVNWSQTSLNNSHVWVFAVSGNNLFAGTQVNGVYLTTNNGTNWIQTPLGHSIISLTAKGDTVFAGTASESGGGQGVYVSTNSGANWVQTSLSSANLSFALKGDTVFAGTFLNGLNWTSNNGANWTPAGLSGSIDAIAVNGNNVFATVRNSGVYVSVNGGSWTLWNEGLGNRIMNEFFIFNNFIYLGTNYGVWKRALSELTTINPVSNETPNQFSLSQNYPNPFNPTTKISFSIPLLRGVSAEGGRGVLTKLKIYDILGREAATLVNEQLNPGTYEVEWDGANYPSGVYYYTLQTDEFTQTRKMILIK